MSWRHAVAVVLAAFNQKSHSLQWKVPKLGSQKVPEDQQCASSVNEGINDRYVGDGRPRTLLLFMFKGFHSASYLEHAEKWQDRLDNLSQLWKLQSYRCQR